MKDLGYESLRISLSEKDFNNKLKKIKKAEIRYKDENIQKTEEDFIDGDFLEVFKDTGIEKNLVSVFVLTLNLLDIIRKDKNDQDLFKNIFSFGSPDYGTMQKLLDIINRYRSLPFSDSLSHFCGTRHLCRLYYRIGCRASLHITR